jgi:hypothetical protein
LVRPFLLSKNPMTELSPAANAVLTAVTLTRYDVPPEGLPAFAEEMAPLIAAALRAAVAHTQQHHGHDVYSREVWECDADELLAIADELEAQ